MYCTFNPTLCFSKIVPCHIELWYWAKVLRATCYIISDIPSDDVLSIMPTLVQRQKKSVLIQYCNVDPIVMLWLSQSRWYHPHFSREKYCRGRDELTRDLVSAALAWYDIVALFSTSSSSYFLFFAGRSVTVILLTRWEKRKKRKRKKE